LQPIRLSGARDKVAKKAYARAPRFAHPALEKALAECKADKSWNTFETATPGHAVMLDEPQWLADILLQAASNIYSNFKHRIPRGIPSRVAENGHAAATPPA
jgi:hypothetical protein